MIVLPPGQRAIEGFPRFGAHFKAPPPEVPSNPKVRIEGAVSAPIEIAVSEIAALPRRDQTADFHCVAGWTAVGLRWGGVPFAEFYAQRIAPLLPPDQAVTHLAFDGLDGHRAIVELQDALAPDVLLALTLGDEPLNADHGAPIRLISPSQYGFMSTKHLCRIEVCTGTPRERYHPNHVIQFLFQVVKPHQRARVWQEERHRHLPARVVRPVYLRLMPLFRRLTGARLTARQAAERG